MYPLSRGTRGVYPLRCDRDASVFFTEIALTLIKPAIFLAKVLKLNQNKSENHLLNLNYPLLFTSTVSLHHPPTQPTVCAAERLSRLLLLPYWVAGQQAA